MDASFALLAFVAIALVSMIMVIGAQVFLILKEFRKTVMKTNKILDDSGVISESISKPINLVSGAVMGIKGGQILMKMLGSKEKTN